MKLLLVVLSSLALAKATNDKRPNPLNKLGLDVLKVDDLDKVLDSPSVGDVIEKLNVEKDTKKTLNLAAGFHKRLAKGDKKDFNDFFTFIANHNKTYSDESGLKTRFGRFREALKRIEAEKKQGGSAEFGITRFADLSKEEFLKGFTGAKVGKRQNGTGVIEQKETIRAKRQALPTSFDWRTKNAVTNIKDQAGCGSCYAFASAAAVESVYAIKYNERYDTSEQQIVSCSTDNYGCNGGFTDLTLKYINNDGLGMESAYPYTSGNGGVQGTCQNKPKYGFIKGFSYVATNEEGMRSALVNQGPLVVILDANFLQDYRSGILNPKKPANGWEINHAVVAVGYGTENGTPYWIVRNSWGPNWGEQGYFRLIRNQNALNIAFMPVVPIAYDW